MSRNTRLDSYERAGTPAEETTATTMETDSPTYRGERDPTAPVGEECTVTVNGNQLDARYDLLEASPTGYEWGYKGSGPAQLAIAILADAYDDEFACEYYQQFKRDVIADLPDEEWTLGKHELDTWREEATV